MARRDNLLDAPRYRALVLGPFNVERDGLSLDATNWQRRVQTLFKLLVTAPGRQRRRDDLIEILWPEADPDAATGNLRILVHRLRLTLGCNPSPVLSRNGWVTLNPSYTWDLDLEEMEALVGDSHGDVSRLQTAIAMVRGEPFAEDRYDDWAVPLTARAMRVWRDACLQLATLLSVRGHHDESAAWYERLLDADPLDEEALRGVMAAAARARRPADALRRYERFRAKLADELDAEPAAETELLVEQIRKQAEMQEGEVPLQSGGFLGAVPEGPLIGRVEELERAVLPFDTVPTGAGHLVMVSGEVGVGKTRLAQEVMIRLRDRGVLIATARCYARDQAVPFAPFLDLLAQIHAMAPPMLKEEVGKRWPHLTLLLPYSRMIPSDLVPEDPSEQHTLFRDCAGFLARVAHERPLALLLDDLHWSDEGSLDLLCYLAREMRGRGVFMLGAYRDGDISRDHPLTRTIRDMAREGVVERLILGRLRPEETAELVASLLGEGKAPSDFSEFVYHRTRGNPLFVRKVVQALGGRYRLIRQVGAGGMGRVFEAVDDRTGERVAIKLMFARTEVDPKALLRFQQEGIVLASLHHPNIVQVHGTFVEEYASCITMELLDGRSLAELIEDGPLALDRVKALIVQILAALAMAHERGVVHRDVKPANVMVLEGDHAKVTDFGIARLARPASETNLTSTGMTLGTPLYMAPEQVQGGAIDARTDLYAVGALLYEMVTGKPPFDADNAITVAFMQVNEAPVPPRALRPGIPEEWDAVILRALAKSPADRFQSAVAMERALSILPTTEEEPASRRLPSIGSRITPPLEPARRYSPWGTARILPGVVPLFLAIVLGVMFVGPRFLWAHSSVSALLHGPVGVAVDPRGEVYVSDQGNNRVVEFNASGTAVHAWGTVGRGTMQFNSPGDLVLAPDGRAYVVDTTNRRIEVLRGGRQVDEAKWNAGSLALDLAGDLFASDFGHRRIWEFGANLQLLRTISIPEIDVGAQPFPAGVAVDRRGNLYVADREHNRIVKLSPTGTVLAAFGRYGTGRPVLGTGMPLFDMPSDVAVDGRGRMYVADTRNDRIQILSPTGRVLAILPGIHDLHTQLGQVVSLALGPHEDIYVAEYYDNQVLKLSPDGTVLWVTPSS